MKLTLRQDVRACRLQAGEYREWRSRGVVRGILVGCPACGRPILLTAVGPSVCARCGDRRTLVKESGELFLR